MSNSLTPSRIIFLIALLQNSSGSYISPSLDFRSKKRPKAWTLPDDMKVMITNSPNAAAYPIVGFTWILAYVNQTDKAKGTELVICSVVGDFMTASNSAML